MQLTYVFSELGNGLRRNISMTLAVIVTIFVSLTLVGMGLLLNAQANKAEELLGQQAPDHRLPLQPELLTPNCVDGEVTAPQKASIEKVLDSNAEVASWRLQSKQEAYDKWTRGLRLGQRHRATRLRVHPALGHAGVLLGAAEEPRAVPGHQERGPGDGRRQHRPRPARGAQADLLLDERDEVGGARDRRASSWSRRSCRSATPSGSRRSRGDARSASCGWSAPPASTSSCRS